MDGRGAAGADQGQPAPSTAGWLRTRLRLGATAAAGWVRTARALYRGPLTETGQALADGKLSAAHAQVLGPRHPRPARLHHCRGRAGPAAAARRLDPSRLRRVVTHLRWVADPDTAEGRAERQHQQRGLWLSPTIEGMVALDGLLEPEAGQTVLAALEPLAHPAGAADHRSASSDAPTGCRAGPPHPGGGPAAADRRGPAPADGHRGPGQPPRPSPRPGWGGRRGRAAGCRGVPAVGL